jgi:hypothetical protein
MVYSLCLLLVILPNVASFATWFASDYCSIELVESSIIMNNEAMLDNERYVRVYREGVELKSGALYVPGEVLEVHLSDIKGQYVFEAANAKFKSGGCSGRRSTSRGSELAIANEENADIVSIRAGWATGHGTVYITPDFVLSKSNTRAQDGSGSSGQGQGQEEEGQVQGNLRNPSTADGGRQAKPGWKRPKSKGGKSPPKKGGRWK